MQNYQPRYFNPAYTMPYNADKLRSKQLSYFPSTNNDAIVDIEIGNDPIKKQWQQDAINKANLQLQSTNSSKRNLLMPRHPRLECNNVASMPFQTSIDQSYNPYARVSGGQGVATQSSRLSDEDRKIARKRILARFADNYTKFNNLDTTEYPKHEQFLLEGNKLELHLMLNKLTTSIYSNEPDAELFANFYEFLQILIKTAPYLSNEDYVNLEDVFLTFINATQEYASRLPKTRKKIRDQQRQYIDDYTRIVGRTDIQGQRFNLSEDIPTTEQPFINAIRELVQGIYNYIRENHKGIEFDEKARTLLAKASIKLVKMPKIDNLLKKTVIGKDINSILDERDNQKQELENLKDRVDEELQLQEQQQEQQRQQLQLQQEQNQQLEDIPYADYMLLNHDDD